MNSTDNIALGEAVIQPNQPVQAGIFTTIIFSYTAGHPIDDSGYVKIVFRSVSDIGTPQFEDPAAPNYCTISTNGDCRIEPRWDPKGHRRPWSRALFLKIRGGFLNTGEYIRVVFGDKTGGSVGWGMQTFCEDPFEFKTLVDPIATYQFKELPESPRLSIVPGPSDRAICIAPSQVVIDKEFAYYLKLEDKWGNPTSKPVKCIHPGFQKPGLQTVVKMDEKTNLSARSNPIVVLEESAALSHYWADFHGQTQETVGAGTIDQYFTFARDYGLLDISGHQGNDFQITDEFWDKINKVTKAYYKPGSFVTFPGYEWSGNTPLGGDRNVFYTSEGGAITRSCADLIPDGQAGHKNSRTADELFRNLKEFPDPQPFAFAHVGGRYADISMHDPDIELAVEVHSAWGTFEWLVDEALQRGYRVGICANSDGHKCRPGASYPGAGEFGSYGGLTCVLARKLDRESVYEALVNRHFYATTGNRTLLEVEVVTNDGDTAIMGDFLEFRDGPENRLQLHVRMVGTAPIESVEVRNGTKIVKTMRPFSHTDLGNRIKIVWRGAQVRGRDRVVKWDGGLRVVGNTISDVKPINFWNANHPVDFLDHYQVAWKSSTTGGVSGVILTFEKKRVGTLEIKTPDNIIECDIGSINLEKSVWDLGGLGKKIEIYRLPQNPQVPNFSFTMPLTELHKGENAIYVQITQEDGHMAWSSPVYLKM